MVGNTGHVFPDPFDPVEVFLHDVPPAVAAASAGHVRRQSETVFRDLWPLDSWPDVATRAVACRDDRFFPMEFQRKVLKDRLAIDPDELPGGHLPALSHPGELVDYLEQCRTDNIR